MPILKKINTFFVNLMPSFMVHAFAGPYLGGNSLDEGVQKAKELWKNNKLASTMDMLGEDLENETDVEHAVSIYLKLVDKLVDEKMSHYTTISVKPSSLGVLIGDKYYLEQVKKVVAYAYERDIEIAIDMEDHNYTDITLESYKMLKPDFSTLGAVLQTRLFRTPRDIEELGDINARIRLCIGIYNEPKDIALTKKKEMKALLVEQAQTLIDNGHFCAFATHDEKILYQMMELAKNKNYSPQQLEYQMLLGVPRKKIQKEIIDLGYTMRLYVPFAEIKENATAYLKRRLAANPLMAFAVMRNILRIIFKPQK